MPPARIQVLGVCSNWSRARVNPLQLEGGLSSYNEERLLKLMRYILYRDLPRARIGLLMCLLGHWVLTVWRGVPGFFPSSYICGLVDEYETAVVMIQ